MFCRSCGTENVDGMPTCTACGNPLQPVNPYQTGQAGIVSAPQVNKPSNYLVQAILVTLCCCIPLGIVSIVYAAQVDAKWNAGDYQGAILASQNANRWSWIGFGVGVVVGLLYFGLQILAIGAAANQGF